MIVKVLSINVEAVNQVDFFVITNLRVVFTRRESN